MVNSAPPSRPPSRSPTPVPSPKPISLSTLSVSKPTRSISSLQVQSSPSPKPTQQHMQSIPSSGVQSSASSVINVDLTEGILVPEVDAEVDIIEGDAAGAIAGFRRSPAEDEVSKKALRDQLRRTLSARDSPNDMTASFRSRRSQKATDIEEESVQIADSYPPRQYFVLTDAGKPVFTSRSMSRDPDELANIIGIMQALISVFLDDRDKLRCINAGKTRINFLVRSPIYYASVSSWGEPESVTRSHLEYLHLQVLSIVSGGQLRRIFERRTNFDLGRLLNGAEILIHSMLDRVQDDLAMSTSSLHCLRMDPGLRARVASALLPSSRMKDLLYIILIGRGRVITLVRPRKHSIHPADLHILTNTAHSPSIVNSSASASWLPMCLPKFDASAFVNAYITFLQPQPPPPPPENDISAEGTVPEGDEPREQDDRPETSPEDDDSLVNESTDPSSVCLICVSGNGDFESVRTWCDTVYKKLDGDGTLGTILDSIRKGATEYSVSELSIPGLRHFIYKSRAHVQITVPVYEDPYDTDNEQRRLITLYQILHDNIHAKSGQETPLKLQYIKTQKESVMGWITQPFEMYITLSPWMPKSAAIHAANSVARWVKKEESRLFLRDAPVF